MIRTRFAPSPTGSLHVGGVRTALYCLLFARKAGGRFVLRIEDTDQARSTEEAAQGILRDMQWCGLMWDEGPGVQGEAAPYYQSQRLGTYNQYIDQLLASGHAYLAWDSKDELDALRKEAEARKATFRYRRRPVTELQVAQWTAEGRVPVVRLEAPKHDVVVEDAVLGTVTVTEADLEDIVIRKADGFPTYHFAVVIDDHLMGIRQVLRGQEHLLNTHKHAGIAEALGWELPRVGHLPLIFNPAGAKMSKREKAQVAREAAKKEHKARNGADLHWLADLSGLSLADVAGFVGKEHDRVSTAEGVAKALGVELPMIEVMDFRRAGYVPEALINYMALLGWNPGDEREILALDEMIAAFSLDRVNHTAARFDPEKLRWMNGEYLKRLFANDAPRLLVVARQWLEVVETPIRDLSDADLLALIALYKDRASTLAEIEKASRYLFTRPTSFDAKAVDKWMVKGGGAEALARCAPILREVPWNAAAIEAALAPIGEGNMGKVAQPLRIALTGTAVSPPIFETLVLVSREEALARVQALLERCAS